jgi:uncharacterized membrane protein
MMNFRLLSLPAMHHFAAHFSIRLFLLSLLLLYLLVLTALTLTAQGQPTTVVQADSLRGVLREGKPDTIRVQVLLKLSEYYQRRTLDAGQNRDTALVLAKQAGN